ncbi:DUF805 domain-containing protein [Pseudomonas sichuanensis]|uniref:DUF805 domain-containing protein n=1 Tax=Pseudomonas sichuanensis TaxID=2213015 RepID=A0ABV0DKW3_9PSED|nr:hypothetical protein [Pseudomonas sichuanensis]
MSMVFCRGCAKQIHQSALSCPGCGATQAATATNGGFVGSVEVSSGTPYLEVLKKYAVFKGRARRKEYWLFVLINFLITIAFGYLDNVLGTNPLLSLVYALVLMIPSIAVAVRRLHDSDHRGWWLLVPIVGLVFLFIDGTPGNNRFGPSPKGLV